MTSQGIGHGTEGERMGKEPEQVPGGHIALRVNGEPRTVPAGTTVADLLDALELVPGMVVVERNRQILDRSRYVEVELEAGDVLELVHFVGGG
jgi:thiamine biosynthesis protein ThiS